MFVKQNKRVLKIFESENSDNEEPVVSATKTKICFYS